MKKIIFALLAAATLTAAATETFAKPKITVKVDIGKKSKDCDKFSICSVTVGAELATSTLALDPMTSVFTVGVSQSDLQRQPEKLIYFEGQRFVTFDETWIATDDINQALDAATPIVIHPGQYPLTFVNGLYTFSVPQK